MDEIDVEDDGGDEGEEDVFVRDKVESVQQTHADRRADQRPCVREE